MKEQWKGVWRAMSEEVDSAVASFTALASSASSLFVFDVFSGGFPPCSNLAITSNLLQENLLEV